MNYRAVQGIETEPSEGTSLWVDLEKLRDLGFEERSWPHSKGAKVNAGIWSVMQKLQQTTGESWTWSWEGNTQKVGVPGADDQPQGKIDEGNFTHWAPTLCVCGGGVGGQYGRCFLHFIGYAGIISILYWRK